MAPRQLGQRGADVLEAFAEVLAPVARDQQQRALRVHPGMAPGNVAGELGPGIEPVAQRGQRIDDGIAGHGDAALQVLAQQVGTRRGRGREHPLADHIDHAAVHFLGKGLGQIPVRRPASTWPTGMRR